MNARLILYSVEEVKVLRSALGLKELNINDRLDNLSGLDRLFLELELEDVKALAFRLEHVVQKWHDEEKAGRDKAQLEVEGGAEFLASLHRDYPGVELELRELEGEGDDQVSLQE